MVKYEQGAEQPPREGSSIFAPSGGGKTGFGNNCSICSFGDAIYLLLFGLAFVTGVTVAKETAVNHFVSDKKHNNRTIMAIAILAVLMFFLILGGYFSIGILLIVVASFAVGFVFKRSSLNYNKKELSYSHQYNNF